MKTFSLVITSPDGDIYRDSAAKLSLRGAMGDLAIMAGHIPFVTPVQPCDCTIETENGEVKTGHLDGGVLTVFRETVTLLSGSFSWNHIL